MDTVLAFLGKFFGATARVGAVAAFSALVVWILVQSRIPPFASLEGTSLLVYQGLTLAGIIGTSIVIVTAVIALW